MLMVLVAVVSRGIDRGGNSVSDYKCGQAAVLAAQSQPCRPLKALQHQGCPWPLTWGSLGLLKSQALALTPWSRSG